MVALAFLDTLLNTLAVGIRRAFKSTYNSFDIFIAVVLIIVLVGTESITEASICPLALRILQLGRNDMWGFNKDDKDHPVPTLLYWVDLAVQRISTRRIVERGQNVRKPRFSITRKLQHMNKQLSNAMRRTVALIAFSAFVMFFTWYIYAAIGVQIIGDSLAAIDQMSGATMNGAYGEMTNLKDLKHSMVAMFQVLITNNWNDLLYTSIAAKGHSVTIFWITFYIVINLVFMNIIISTVLISLQQEEESFDNLKGLDMMDKRGRLDIEVDGLLYRLEPKRKSLGQGLFKDLLNVKGFKLLTECVKSGLYEDALLNTKQNYGEKLADGVVAANNPISKAAVKMESMRHTRTWSTSSSMNALGTFDIAEAVKVLIYEIRFFPPELRPPGLDDCWHASRQSDSSAGTLDADDLHSQAPSISDFPVNSGSSAIADHCRSPSRIDRTKPGLTTDLDAEILGNLGPEIIQV